MDSPELIVALQAADAFTDAADELKAAFARAEDNGTVLQLDEYGPILKRIDVAETNFKAAIARLRGSPDA